MRALDPPPEQEFSEDQARLDGLAQADIVSKQQADPRHTQRLEQRHELKVVNLDRTMERARNRQPPERAGSVGVDEGSRGGPASCAQQRVEVFDRHGVA